MDGNKIFTAALFSSFGIMTACGLTESVVGTQKADKNTVVNSTVNVTANKKENAGNKAADNIQSKTVELFDGRSGEIKNAKPSEAETALVEKEVRIKTKEDFLKKRLEGLAENVDWQKQFLVDGAVEGSFTKADSKQKAVLYRFSYTNGVIILEEGNIVAHYSGGPGDYAFYFAIKALPDINQNGLSEIILFRNVEDSEAIYAYLFELKNGAMSFSGETVYFNSTYEAGGDVESRKAEQTAYHVTVKPSANPAFAREIYARTGNNGKWILTKQNEKFIWEKTGEYDLTKI